MGDVDLNGTFCLNGGMNLGFVTPGSEAAACVVFLFENWVLDSAAKYAFAVVGTFFLAMVPEALTWLRHKKIAKMRRERHKLRLFAYAVAFFIQVVVSYWLMLIVMTYSTYLFLAVVFGITFAHLCFMNRNLDTDALAGCGVVNTRNSDDGSIERELLKA